MAARSGRAGAIRARSNRALIIIITIFLGGLSIDSFSC